jgi:hypothetical protein
VLLAPAERAAGYPVTFEFAGEVALFTDTNDLLGGTVEVGTPFSGSFTFESTTPDTLPDDPGVGIYDNAILSISGDVGGSPFALVDPVETYISIRNDAVSIGLDVYNVRAAVDFVGARVDLTLTVSDSMQSLLSSDALPLFPPSLEMSTSSGFGFGAQEIGLGVFGPLNALIPEPGTMALLGVGALLLAGRARMGCQPDRRIQCGILDGQAAANDATNHEGDRP